MTDQLAIHLTNARHHLDTAEHHQWEAIKPIVAALGHLYDAVHALAEPAVSPAAVALVSAGHHPADPDAADRLTAYFQPDRFPGFTIDNDRDWTSEQVCSVLEHHREFLRQTIEPSVREMLQQRADARQRSMELADKCAAYRSERDDYHAEADALVNDLAKARAERDTWKGRAQGLQDERDEAVQHLHRLVDHQDDECQFDHHGCCQTHWVDGGAPGKCGVVEARAFLDGAPDATDRQDGAQEPPSRPPAALAGPAQETAARDAQEPA